MINGLVWSLVDVQRRRLERDGLTHAQQLSTHFNDVLDRVYCRAADPFEELAGLAACALGWLAEIEEERAR